MLGIPRQNSSLEYIEIDESLLATKDSTYMLGKCLVDRLVDG